MNQNEITPTPTTLTDVNIPFGRLVVIILKVMIASIPALIIFYAIIFAIAFAVAIVFGGGAAVLQHLLHQGPPQSSF